MTSDLFVFQLFWRCYYLTEVFFANRRRKAYKNSPASQQDQKTFRKKTGLGKDDPIFKEYGWVSPDVSIGQKGYYVKNNDLNGTKYLPVNGQMMPIPQK